MVAAFGSHDGQSLLERTTRRFLIDPVLKALGWDPDDRGQVAEEARSRSASGERFYFDYLGKTISQLPALIVEAKHFDAEPVRERQGPLASGREASRLISEALFQIRQGGRSRLLAVWEEWLRSLRDYVLSLDAATRDSLRRVAMTAGS
ncbi:hypothetical protein [Burkholderia multivorans]|uniref:hypothetical protein n=1 Tax=Burkholderia multivorans TaxID=87883 RepID=UPI0011B25F6B|nr:hypothetical protein [Burkholderia multivorans]